MFRCGISHTGYFADWSDVTGWVGHGGAYLGTKRTLPGHRMGLVASRMEEFGIQALLIIGGFEVKGGRVRGNFVGDNAGENCRAFKRLCS